MQYKTQEKVITGNSYQKYVCFNCTWFNISSSNQRSYHDVVDTVRQRTRTSGADQCISQSEKAFLTDFFTTLCSLICPRQWDIHKLNGLSHL